MLDIKYICDHADAADAAFAKRGLAPQSARLCALDAKRRACIRAAQDLQTRRNEISKKIGQAKAQKNEIEAEKMMQQVSQIKSELAQAEEDERHAQAALMDALAQLPNLPLDDVPVGEDEAANVEMRQCGTDMIVQKNNALQHFEIGEELQLMDFTTAATLSGARFVILRGALARLERALASFMLDLHVTEFGYEEIAPPVLVRDEIMFGTGQLPKFAEDSFRTENGFWLIPTAEVSLTNMVREKIIDADELPLRFTAFTPCFRSEAGAAGRDTRGMIRQHQFSKVELVSIIEADDANDELERMTACAEEVLKRLDLPYRVMLLSTGDMGFAARKTYDLEVWLPGQNMYREISSCSYCGDFQARRMNARWRAKEDKQTQFVHTLNGSALAVGRTMVALLENYFDPEAKCLHIPAILHSYMGGIKQIDADIISQDKT